MTKTALMPPERKNPHQQQMGVATLKNSTEKGKEEEEEEEENRV